MKTIKKFYFIYTIILQNYVSNFGFCRPLIQNLFLFDKGTRRKFLADSQYDLSKTI